MRQNSHHTPTSALVAVSQKAWLSASPKATLVATLVAWLAVGAIIPREGMGAA